MTTVRQSDRLSVRQRALRALLVFSLQPLAFSLSSGADLPAPLAPPPGVGFTSNSRVIALVAWSRTAAQTDAALRAIVAEQSAEISALRAQIVALSSVISPPSSDAAQHMRVHFVWDRDDSAATVGDVGHFKLTPETAAEWQAAVAAEEAFGQSGGQTVGQSDSITLAATAYTAQSGLEPSGAAMGYFDPGDWLEFSVVCPPSSAFRSVSISAASPAAGSVVEILIDNASVGTVTLSASGSWTAYQSAVRPLSSVLSAGAHTVRVLGVTAAQSQGIADVASVTFSP